MRKIVFILFLLMSELSFVFGQESNMTITMNKERGNYVYYQGSNKLKMKDLTNIIKTNEVAYKEFKSAKTTYVFSQTLGFVGGFMVGWTLGEMIGGRDPNWTVAGIGVGLATVSFPLFKSYGKKAKNAIDIYNLGLKTTSFWDRKQLNLSMSQNGIGLTLSF